MPDTAFRTYESRLPMAAAADVVLNTAADLTRAGAWLPRPLSLAAPRSDGDMAPGGVVEARWSPGGQPHRFEVRLVPEELRLEWQPAGPGPWAGRLRVTDDGAGSSVAEVRVSAADGVAADDVRGFLERALRGLAGEVDRNFNVS